MNEDTSLVMRKISGYGYLNFSGNKSLTSWKKLNDDSLCLLKGVSEITRLRAIDLSKACHGQKFSLRASSE